jgi:hypothetical protein
MMSYTHLGMVVKFFFGFMVAILLFSVVLFFSIYEGVHKLMEPIAIKNIGWGSCFRCFIIEGKTFMIALKQLRETSKNSIIKALKDSVDTNLLYLKIQQHY